MIFAALLLIGSMCFAQRARSLGDLHEVNVQAQTLPAKATGWYGTSAVSYIETFEMGDYMILRPETFAGATTVGDQVTKVKFYNYQHSSYADYTNMSFTIKIYQGSSMTADLISDSYTTDVDAALGTLVYVQEYTADDYGEQTVELTEPYTITSANYWIAIQCNGQSLLVYSMGNQISTTVTLEEYQSDTYPNITIDDFSETQFLRYYNENSEFTAYYNLFYTDNSHTNIAFFYTLPYFQIFVQGSEQYVSSSDFEVKWFGGISGNNLTEAQTSYTLASTESLTLLPFFRNNGNDDAEEGIVTFDVTVGGINIYNNPIDLGTADDDSKIAVGGYYYLIENPYSLTITAEDMNDWGLWGTFDVCFTVSYTGNDPNPDNDIHCISVTRPIEADFTTNPGAINDAVTIGMGESVTFTNTSVYYHHNSWTFEGGDPATSTDYEVTVAYAQTGTYTATLTIYNADETISNTKSVYVVVNSVDPGANEGNCDPITSFPYEEGFENGIPECWTTIDADGDGNGWVLGSATDGIYLNGGNIAGVGHEESTDMMVSGSYSNVTSSALTPDNWLITPAISLPAGSPASISFWAASQDASYAVEHYGVYVSTTTTDTDAFTLLWDENMDANGGNHSKVQGAWREKHADLSDYAGQTIYIAFRHFNCSDMFLLLIDDITIDLLEIHSYTITATAGEHGSIDPMGEVSVVEGSDQTFTITPEDGYIISSLIVDGMETTVSGTYTFYDVNEDHSIEVSFEEIICDPITSFPYEEGFENGIPQCWTLIDEDGDGYNWMAFSEHPTLSSLDAHNGSNAAISESYRNTTGAFQANNWMITSAIEIPSNGHYKATWYAKNIDGSYPDTYSVYIGTEPTIDNMTANEAVVTHTPGTSWEKKKIMLSEYAGQTIYIGFNHNDSDKYVIMIDDFSITEVVSGLPCTFEEEASLYTVGQNSSSDANWELQTISESTGASHYWSLNSLNESHPKGTYSNTPQHWMMIDGGGLVVDGVGTGYDFDSYMLFAGVDLSESEHPMLNFYEYRRLYNIPPSMEATVVEVSTNGGSSWTKHVVGCEQMSEQGFANRRVPIFEAAGYDNVMVRFRAQRQESYLYDNYGVGYSAANFIVVWSVDDITIEEALELDLVITDVRMNKGRCDYYSNQEMLDMGYDYRNYQQHSMFGQTPLSEWQSDGMFASFNVAVENRGYLSVAPTVNITVTSPSGDIVWTDSFVSSTEISAYERDTIDVFEIIGDEYDHIFNFTEAQRQNIETGEYIVNYSVSTTLAEDPTPDNNETSHSFYITEEAYSPATPNITTTSGPNYWTGFVDGDEIIAEYTYYTLPSQELPVFVYISGSTTPGAQIIANIYEYSTNVYDYQVTNSSSLYTITSDDLGRWINIPLQSPLMLTSFDDGTSPQSKTVRVGIAFYPNGGTLSIGASNDMPNKGWVCKYKMSGNVTSYNVTTESAAPAISLGDPRDKYTITVLSANESYGSVDGGGIFHEGDEISISAEPSDGYRFVSWDDGNTDNPRTITVTGDATYIADFVAQYTITVLSEDDSQGSAIGSGIYDEGQEITIEAVPNDGFLFSSWNDGSTENPRIITVTAEATYTASFVDAESVNSYTIEVLSANSEMGSVSGSGTYAEGTVIMISATANDGYRFIGWTDGNNDNPRNITVIENASYTANFEVIPVYTITVLANSDEYGTVDGGGTFYENEEIQISATPYYGHRFVSWDDNNIDNPRTITVIEDATYTANFIAQYTIRVLSSNNTQGSVAGAGTFDDGEVITIEAIPNEGYFFVSWDDGNTENPRVVTVTENVTYVASFADAESVVSYTITVTTDTPEIGSVSGTGTYAEGTVVMISADPHHGYRFVSWNDGNTDNPRSITVTEDASYTAIFEQLPTYTIMAEANNGGTINPEEATVLEGEDASFTIAANDCYRIASVMVDETDVTSDLVDGVYTLTSVDDNHTIAATFEQIPYTITVNAGENGTITPNNEGSVIVNCGGDMAFTIVANDHYRIASVTVDNADVTSELVDGIYTFVNVIADHTIAATFEALSTYTITATAGANGTITPEDAIVEEGADQAFTIAANEGYRIASVAVDNADVTSELVDGVYTFVNVTANHTIAATFEALPTYTITATAGANGTITPNGEVVVNEGATQAFTIAANEDFQIASVTVDNADVTSELVDGVYTFVNVTANHTIAATFEAIPTYTITATAGANGTITPNGEVVVNEGATQAFIIAANEGFQIASVVVDGDTDVTSELVEGVYTFTNVRLNHTIVATFEALPQPATYTITLTVGGHGTVTPSGENGIVTVNAGDDAVFTITPDDGYVIEALIVDGNPLYCDPTGETYTFTAVAANHTLSVTFGPVSSAEMFEVGFMTVYPNPNNGMFSIDFSNIEGDAIYQIIDARGAVVETRDINVMDGETMNFNHDLRAGTYFVRIINGDKVYVEQIVVE